MIRDEQVDRLLHALSRLLGWIYVLSWSASFYPQAFLNWKRRATHGLTVDFPLLNVVGFIAYTTATACFLYSPIIRAQYALRHPASSEPTVKFNDLAFGAHAVVLVIITYSQFYPRLWGFEVSRLQRASRPVVGIVVGSFFSVSATAVFVLVKSGLEDQDGLDWAWIDVIYTIGYIKLIVTFVKYIPQAWFNFKRKSTLGWSIDQVLFDVTGGILSLLQLLIDASFQGDWSGVTGNPVKLGLGGVSIFFDLIFITQHYVLYRQPAVARLKSLETDPDESHRPLLDSS